MKASSSQRQGLPVIHERAAGIDIGSRFHVVAVPVDLAKEPVQTFKAFTADLERMADWLVELGVTTVAMESTGVYWIPVYEILESHGLHVVLANARDARAVPGRKTDVNDAQWIQRLHACGLLRASFHPDREIAALRSYLRLRELHLDYAAAHIQHMQKALTHMNLQLQHVVADITGAPACGSSGRLSPASATRRSWQPCAMPAANRALRPSRVPWWAITSRHMCLAESFVKTMKRDYIGHMPKPDRATALRNLAIAFEHYNEQHPHSALNYRSPGEFRRLATTST